MGHRLKDKVAVVSGIASGIGQATALRFAEEGAIVLGFDINEEGANDTAEQAAKAGFPLHSATRLDMLDEAAVASFFQRAGEEFGRVEILINAAAGVKFGWVDEQPTQDFSWTLTQEVESVFIACKAAWPYLKARGGSIVSFASIAAHMAVDVLPGLAHCAGKGAVLAMTRQLALEGSKHGIRANTISPGMVITAATRGAIEGGLPGFADVIKGKVMLGRYGTPEDIAGGCLFLASDESAWVTGADLPIDGGMGAW